MDYQKALEILGATASDDEKTLKDKYYARMREVHPDHGGSTEAAMEVQAAYNTVLEPPLSELESILFDMIASGNEITLDEAKLFFKRIIAECTFKIVSINTKYKAIERSAKRFHKSTPTFKKKIEQELTKLAHQESVYKIRRDSIENLKKEFEESYNTQESPVRPAFLKSTLV